MCRQWIHEAARKNRMAQVMVVGRPERLTSGVAAFLDSFRFLDDPGKGR